MKNSKKQIRIKTTKNGPFLVEGNPKIVEQFIENNADGHSWEYREGRDFTRPDGTIALCRCGKSKNKPFCDGSHQHADFDGTTTAPHTPIMDNAQTIKGPNYTLYDNEMYCAFARFCDAYGRVWNLVQEGNEDTDKLAIRETLNCPAGRLMIMDNQTGEMIEKDEAPMIGVLEDTPLNRHGPLCCNGNCVVEDENGQPYEQRTRQTLCRCGHSNNKPFCNGAHASPAAKDTKIK